jgi:DNA-binding response OmpR family regulator
MMLKKVLIVDDEPDYCDALRDLLRSRGFEVAIALSGEEALPAYMQEKPDVVLLDIQMPGMDGLETLQELKVLDQGANVIMVTAIEDDEIVMRAMAEGALDYIIKPVDLYYLVLGLTTKSGLFGKR